MTFPSTSIPCGIEKIPYEKARNLIKTGDILICSGNSFFSNLIKTATNSIWSHVAFIIKIDEIDRLMVLESVENIGTRTVTLSSYVKNYNGSGEKYNGQLMILRHSKFKESFKKSLSLKAIDCLGHQYDSEEIARIAAKITLGKIIKNGNCQYDLPKDDCKYICSEYVYECFKSIGIKLNINCMGYVAPSDFCNDIDINPVFLIN